MELVKLSSEGVCRGDPRCFEIQGLPDGWTVTATADQLGIASPASTLEINGNIICLTAFEGEETANYQLNITACPL